MNIPWNEVELFLAVAESGSVSAAGKRLRTTQPTVSRRLAELEAVLGEPLFARTVSGTTPTSFGERMLPAARRMAEAAGEVQRVADGAVATPKGVVRVTAAPGVAYTFLVPIAAKLRQQLPEIQLEVVAATSYLDLARREADLAIRSQALDRKSTQRDLVILATHTSRAAAFATPTVAAALPANPRVTDVPWIAWAPPFEQLAPNPQLEKLVPGFAPVFAATDYIVQLRAAEAGVGAVLFDQLGRSYAAAAGLVELPLALDKLISTVNLVSSRSALAIPRVKAVADVLARAFKLAGKTTGRPLRPGA
ncbi:MAG: LysR family transcriptional regulator [Kofleriaceae bacterium]